MTTFFNQWKWDFRRIFPVWAPWILLLLLVALGRTILLKSDTHDSPLILLWSTTVNFTLALLGALLASRILFTTPFGSEAPYWRTLPLKPMTLFWEKSSLILVLILVPLVSSFALPFVLFIPSWTFVRETCALASLHQIHIVLWITLLSALSRRPRNVLLWTAGILIALPLFSTLARLLFHLAIPPSPYNFQIDGSLLLPLALSIGLLLIACYTSSRFRSPKPASYLALVAFFAFSTSGVFWNYRFYEPTSPQTIVQKRLDLRVLAKGEEPLPNATLITPQLTANLPAGQLLFPREMECSFEGNHSFFRLRESFQLAPQLTRLLPPSAERERIPANDSFMPPEWTSDISSPLHIRGSYSGILLEPHLAVTIPLQEGASSLFDKTSRFKILSVDEEDASFNFHIAGLLTSLESRLHEMYFRPGALSLTKRPIGLLLRDPTSNTLFSCKYRFMGTNFSSSPIRKIQFRCHLDKADATYLQELSSSTKALSQLELLVFTYQQTDSVFGDFQRENWIPFGSEEKTTPKPKEKIRWSIAHLSQNPSKEEVEAYLDLILYDLADDIDPVEKKLARSKYHVLSKGHLPALIKRLPVPPPAQQLALETLTQFADESHLPSLLTALEHDPSLATLFSKKGWTKEAAPVLSFLLRNRHHIPQDSIQNVFTIVASAKDPQTYPDLAWLFTQARYRHRTLAQTLSALPNFPLAQTIEEARLLRFNARSSNHEELGYLAAKTGNKEALRELITSLVLSSSSSASQHYQWLDELVDQKSGEDAIAWSHQHFETLVFDSQRHSYALPRS